MVQPVNSALLSLLWLLISLFAYDVTASALPSTLRVETEQEREVTQQLKQANDTVARLQDELSDFRQRSAPLWEKEIKGRNSKIFKLVSVFVRSCYK